jgi:hypothetical protein
MSGPLVFFASHAPVCMASEKLLLAKKSGIIGFDSVFSPVGEGLGTEYVREPGVDDADLAEARGGGEREGREIDSLTG